MDAPAIKTETAAETPLAKIFEKFETSPKGLSAAEADKRLAEYGENAIAEKKVNPLLKFLGYFWGPIPWMIEVAAVLSLIVRHWADFIIIVVLLAFNGLVGFWQEYQAGNAVEALKKKLALKSRALRDGHWQPVNAEELVPGDIIRLRLGDIIPADVMLFEGEYLSVDQSALTGESLPVNKTTGDSAYSGSIAKQGEMLGLVTATGNDTYFGKTAKLVAKAKPVSHFQKAVLQIGDYLIYLSLALVVALILVQLFRGTALLELVQFALILTVASIPVAMPAVLSVTMAVGALALSKLKAIVSRLESIEEMAGMDILCSDKTGTLTQNRLTLYDPPREDSAETIRQAGAHGIAVKMVTGDNLAIAGEIAQQLGLGKTVYAANRLLKGSKDATNMASDTAEKVEQAGGFAQVFPEHKYGIVKALQARGHIVGMTGDGVNDAPALKQADIGIAVSGATDAARAAASLVLTAPGLSVIINAVEEARRIFERMNSYAIYRITETIRIMVFVVLAMIVFNFYPITAIMIILLAFLNDVPIMTIAYDRTGLEPNPVHWNMQRVIAVSTVMGLTGVAGSFLMLYLAIGWLHLTIPQIQTYIFLKMAVAGHLTLFVSRSKGFFLKKPYPAPIMIWSAVGTKLVGTFLAAYGFGLVTPITWSQIGLIWGYSITWSFLTDWAKVWVYRHFGMTATRHQNFLRTVKQSLHHHAVS